MRKQHFFAVLTIGFPVIFFVALEALLKQAPFYRSYSLFEEVQGHPDYLIVNSTFGEQYFSGFNPAIAPVPFLKTKNDSVFRIVVFGESSAAGFPYTPNVSFSTGLQKHFRFNLPQFRTEVINLAMTAVNSFQFVDMMDQVRSIDPDVVLVYTGHNEFYGAYGAASTQGFGGISSPLFRLWMMKIQRTAILQTVKHFSRRSEPLDRRTLMSQVVKEAQIPEDSKIFQTAITGFETNLSTLCRHFSSNGIPVILSSIGSNLKDQKPLGISAEADSVYSNALEFLTRGDTLGAKKYFEKARQLDPLRFRAPSQVNQIIQQTASTIPGVFFVDGEEVLRASGGSAIEGASVYTDHLHPNGRGHWALATIFYEKILEVCDLKKHALRTEPQPWRPLSRFDAAYGEAQIAKLTVDYPFVKDATLTSAKASYLVVERKIRSRSFSDSVAVLVASKPSATIEKLNEAATHALAVGDTVEFSRLAVSLSSFQIFNERFFQKTIPLVMQNSKQLPAAAELSITAAAFFPDPLYAELSGSIFLQMREFVLAKYWLERALRKNSKAESALYNLARLHVMQGDTTTAHSYFVRYKNAKSEK